MKKAIIWVLVLVPGLVLARGEPGNAGEAAPKAEPTNVSVRIPWIRTAATAGLEVADDLGYFKEAGLVLEIKPGSPEASPLRKVLNGEDQFGLLEPAQVLVGVVNQGMPLTILAIKAQKSPFCLMSRTEKGIKSIKDLRGKRVGYNPLNDMSYLAMLKAGGVDRKQIKEIRVQFNLEPFFQDRVEVWPSYISNEPVAARAKGLDVSLICADDIGVHLYEHALFARKDFVAKSPEVVDRFLRAWVKGWQYALANPEQAVDIVVRRAEGLDREHERKVLEIFGGLLTSGEAATHGFGWVDEGMITGVERILYNLGIIRRMPPAAEVMDNQFLRKIDRTIGK